MLALKSSHLGDENSCIKNYAEGLKIDLENITQNLSKISCDSSKQNETLTYVFNRSRGLSIIITDFYHHCYGSRPIDSVHNEHSLSFENVELKLKRVFKDYEILAKKTCRYNFNDQYNALDTQRLKFDSINSVKDKRSISSNIVRHESTYNLRMSNVRNSNWVPFIKRLEPEKEFKIWNTALD